MADVLTPRQRSYCMSQIRGRDTTPELAVRRFLHGLGHRYRLHASDLPGRPDIVFRGRKAAIFVHGCFWHRHRCANGRVMPKTRRSFWLRKLNGNKDRDTINRRKLRRLGWRVMVVWECELRNPARVEEKLRKFLR